MKGWRRATRKRLNRQSETEKHFFIQLLKWGYQPSRNRFFRGISGNSYFVDFYFKRGRVVIELDGSEHDEIQDKKREEDLVAGNGLRFIRFKNWDVWNRLEWVKSIVEASVWKRKKKEKNGRKGNTFYNLKRQCELMDKSFRLTCR